MRIRPGEIIALLARLAVGGVLLYAGFLKALSPSAEFAAVLEAYKLFPASFLTPLSIALPYVEMWVGLFMLTGFCTRLAALAATLLSCAFLTTVGSAFLRGIDLAHCGCFGPQSLTPRHTMVLDIALLILSLIVFQASKLPPLLSLDRSIP
jgi:uncharacterized membrane protein YphA (DoxX/SURF4 family)